MEPSIPFVILMGIGVVFFGLICIILSLPAPTGLSPMWHWGEAW